MQTAMFTLLYMYTGEVQEKQGKLRTKNKYTNTTNQTFGLSATEEVGS